MDPCPPVYSEEDRQNYDWVTRVHAIHVFDTRRSGEKGMQQGHLLGIRML